MLESGGMLAGSTAPMAFVIGSAVCIGLNALFAAWLLIRRRTASTAMGPTSSLKLVAAMAGASLLLLASVGVGILLVSHRQAAAISPPPKSMSIDEIHRQIDIKSLPVQDVSDHM